MQNQIVFKTADINEYQRVSEVLGADVAELHTATVRGLLTELSVEEVAAFKTLFELGFLELVWKPLNGAPAGYRFVLLNYEVALAHWRNGGGVHTVVTGSTKFKSSPDATDPSLKKGKTNRPKDNVIRGTKADPYYVTDMGAEREVQDRAFNEFLHTSRAYHLPKDLARYFLTEGLPLDETGTGGADGWSGNSDFDPDELEHATFYRAHNVTNYQNITTNKNFTKNVRFYKPVIFRPEIIAAGFGQPPQKKSERLDGSGLYRLLRYLGFDERLQYTIPAYVLNTSHELMAQPEGGATIFASALHVNDKRGVTGTRGITTAAVDFHNVDIITPTRSGKIIPPDATKQPSPPGLPQVVVNPNVPPGVGVLAAHATPYMVANATGRAAVAVKNLAKFAAAAVPAQPNPQKKLMIVPRDPAQTDLTVLQSYHTWLTFNLYGLVKKARTYGFVGTGLAAFNMYNHYEPEARYYARRNVMCNAEYAERHYAALCDIANLTPEKVIQRFGQNGVTVNLPAKPGNYASFENGDDPLIVTIGKQHDYRRVRLLVPDGSMGMAEYLIRTIVHGTHRLDPKCKESIGFELVFIEPDLTRLYRAMTVLPALAKRYVKSLDDVTPEIHEQLDVLDWLTRIQIEQYLNSTLPKLYPGTGGGQFTPVKTGKLTEPYPAANAEIVELPDDYLRFTFVMTPLSNHSKIMLQRMSAVNHAPRYFGGTAGAVLTEAGQTLLDETKANVMFHLPVANAQVVQEIPDYVFLAQYQWYAERLSGKRQPYSNEFMATVGIKTGIDFVLCSKTVLLDQTRPYLAKLQCLLAKGGLVAYQLPADWYGNSFTDQVEPAHLRFDIVPYGQDVTQGMYGEEPGAPAPRVLTTNEQAPRRALWGLIDRSWVHPPDLVDYLSEFYVDFSWPVDVKVDKYRPNAIEYGVDAFVGPGHWAVSGGACPPHVCRVAEYVSLRDFNDLYGYLKLDFTLSDEDKNLRTDGGLQYAAKYRKDFHNSHCYHCYHLRLWYDHYQGAMDGTGDYDMPVAVQGEDSNYLLPALTAEELEKFADLTSDPIYKFWVLFQTKLYAEHSVLFSVKATCIVTHSLPAINPLVLMLRRKAQIQ